MLTSADLCDGRLGCSRAGTLTYASPEKASSKAYGSKDDVWALGCIMTELLTAVPLSQVLQH